MNTWYRGGGVDLCVAHKVESMSTRLLTHLLPHLSTFCVIICYKRICHTNYDKIIVRLRSLMYCFSTSVELFMHFGESKIVSLASAARPFVTCAEAIVYLLWF
jgi:phosphatidylinositol kinase/protein kinase (PI-3  family)